MKIRQTLLTDIEQEAHRAYPKESCGLLIGKNGKILQAVPSPNLAQKNDAFKIDPDLHLKTQREVREQGLKIIGCYHSHPGGDSKPSNRDCPQENGAGFLWMITALQDGKVTKTQVFRQLNQSQSPKSRNFVQESLQIHKIVA